MTTKPAAPADPLQADILKEIQGLGPSASVESPDAARLPGAVGAPTPDRDPLDVTPPPPGPAIKRADAVHATRAGGKGYRVVVSGEYFVRASEGKGRITKRYSLAFNVPSLEAILSKLLKKPADGSDGVLTRALKKHYPGAIGPRTHEIVEAKPLSPDTAPTNSLQFMDRARLERYIAENGVPINPADYSEVTTLRDAVIDQKLNPKGFEEREARRQAERAEQRELLDMNPDLIDPAEQKEVPVNA